jgi:aconitase A
MISNSTLRSFNAGQGKEGFYYSLPVLEEAGVGTISRLPVSIRIVLESVLRNCDGKKVSEIDIQRLANWNAKDPIKEEIPFVVARIVLQDFTGVPLLVDLAAMRAAVAKVNRDPKVIEPLVPVDLVVDHSVQASLPLFDRATIGNMAPEYGATMGFFPVDAESVNYLHLTGRSEEACERFENYFKAQGMFGMPLKGEVDYSVNVELDLASVEPSVSGPKRPQDRINLPELKQTFEALFEKPLTEGGYGKKTSDLSLRVPVHINGSNPAGMRGPLASLEIR